MDLTGGAFGGLKILICRRKSYVSGAGDLVNVARYLARCHNRVDAPGLAQSTIQTPEGVSKAGEQGGDEEDEEIHGDKGPKNVQKRGDWAGSREMNDNYAVLERKQA